jgi:cytidyltransferase-like protein
VKTIAIIAEYNPFHNGHIYQIKKIREHFGEDSAVVAIMSGNYVQRGELAIIDKWQRARIAVECGVDLVLELPFPYSSSSAEFA